MTATPKVRPPIHAPSLDGDVPDVCTSVRIVKLSTYQFRDDSEYTVREFDYRLRWTLYATHRSMSSDGQSTVGHAHATVDVWSRRDADWHQVWELSRDAQSPYSPRREAKLFSWNAVLSELAKKATEVLL